MYRRLTCLISFVLLLGISVNIANADIKSDLTGSLTTEAEPRPGIASVVMMGHSRAMQSGRKAGSLAPLSLMAMMIMWTAGKVLYSTQSAAT